MIDFLTIILLVFGVLQIILFFKIWGMTNNINKIKEELELRPKMDDQLITEAQLKALNGEKDQAFRLYQQAFHKNVIEVFNKTINEYGEEDNMDYKERNEYYQLEYNKVGKYFSKRVRKLGLELELDKFNSYDKTYSIICKS
ncbi:hypothetical protein [Bacteroides nordii]|uniref:hypothetical protein n=1 Tax=Bacteroides nordii TaxID=291645 RepID=UPI0018AC3127|nr:hypothetical protein [Bacteroides nordii]